VRGHNNLMYRYPGMDGIKTGFVNASGYNIASAVNIDGKRVIGVMMGGKSARKRDDQMAALLDQYVTGRDTVEIAGTTERSRKHPAETQVAGTTALATELPTPVARREIATAEAATRAASVTSAYAAPPKALAVETMGRPGTPVSAAPRSKTPLWDIQIASADSKAVASGAIETAMPLLSGFGQIAANVQTSRSSGKDVFRARLAGFSDRDAATRACAVLKAKSIDCFVVR
jgi:D-alanyl-D-alanine carboxypeptidase (penicillin-binding protein 5/6)